MTCKNAPHRRVINARYCVDIGFGNDGARVMNIATIYVAMVKLNEIFAIMLLALDKFHLGRKINRSFLNF